MKGVFMRMFIFLLVILLLLPILLFGLKKCPKCGKTYPDELNFCEQCGATLVKVKPKPKPKPKPKKPSIKVNIEVKGDSLIITSIPEGATVYLDGTHKANTPLRIKVSAGSHEIVLKYYSYKDYSTTIETEKIIPTLIYIKKNEKGFEEYRNNIDGSIFIKIPAGEFTMGSNDYSDEKPAHTVHLDEYYIGKYEVTNSQYKKFCDATGRSYPSDPGFKGMSDYFEDYPDCPVVKAYWNDAVAYCKWAGLRLPTEAEWEKAARGTDGRKYPWGNSGPDAGGTYSANYAVRDNFKADGYTYISPVGSYYVGISPYGCYDMAGNVWEWCSDWYDWDYYQDSPKKNPKGSSTGKCRVVRGGSWYSSTGGIRCLNRGRDNPAAGWNDCGFRVAFSPE